MDTSGHLFERRYHCVLVDADHYLLTLIRYIHFNPVRAGLVLDPGEYRWSSHRVYLGLAVRKWVTTSFALEMLSTNPPIAVEKYRSFMGNTPSDRWGKGELTTNQADSQILGDDEFASRVAGARWQPRPTITMATLIAECERRFSVSKEQLASPSKYHALAVARAWLAHAAVAERVATISETARHLKRTEGSIRQLMSRYPRVM